jgi:hypothetical protein
MFYAAIHSMQHYLQYWLCSPDHVLCSYTFYAALSSVLSLHSRPCSMQLYILCSIIFSIGFALRPCSMQLSSYRLKSHLRQHLFIPRRIFSLSSGFALPIMFYTAVFLKVSRVNATADMFFALSSVLALLLLSRLFYTHQSF